METVMNGYQQYVGDVSESGTFGSEHKTSILLQFKFKVTSKNADFGSWYTGTLTKEKPSKISNIAVTIAFFSSKYLNKTAMPTFCDKPSDSLQNGSL